MVETKKTFVCGHPIKHSRSPLIHNYWLEKHGIAGRYERVDIAPNELPLFLSNMGTSGFVGGNFTLPHKEAVYKKVDKLDEAAKVIGAVNTVWIENHKLCGGNTDAYGFSANLDDQIRAWRQSKRALVLGAGGASRAVLYALIKAGVERIDLVNRTLERAQNLSKEFLPHVKPYGWEVADTLVTHSDLIVNCTSIGMDNHEPFPLDLNGAKPTALAADIIYIPIETEFLKAAKKTGLQVSDGLGMLLHQAVPGFEKWYGVRPEVDQHLRQLILNDITDGQNK